MLNEIWLIRSTFAKKDEALSVARSLLSEQLIACANIDGNMTALFRWEGMVQQEAEVVLLAKTTKEKMPAAMARIKALHSYRIPGILAWPVMANVDFAGWIVSEVAS